MNIKRRINVLSIFLVLFLSFFTASNISADSSLNIIELETDTVVLKLNTASGENMSLEEQSNLEAAEKAYSNLFNSFFLNLSNDEKYPEGVYSVSGIPAGCFPDCYAGAYINSNYELVIQLTEESTKTTASVYEGQETISQATGDSELIYAAAEFSYNELVSVMNDIYQYQSSADQERADTTFQICYYMIDDFNNCVEVGLENVSASSIKAFKKYVSDSDAIVFSDAEVTDACDDSTLKPGIGLGTGSTGFHIYKYENGKYIEGFVTAAHCYDPGDTITYGTTTVAYAHSSAWQYGGDVDAVFCVLESGNSFSSTIAYIGGTLKDGIDANLAQGNPVTMVGKSTQGTSGTVTSISYSFTYNSTKFTDFVAADYDRNSGDSGGIVISTRTGSNWIAGIHKGVTNSRSVFSKAQNITNELGLTFNSGD